MDYAKWFRRNARELDLKRYEQVFEGGSARAVADALAAYQNEDGGMGNRLEPDNWNPASTPGTTAHAIDVLAQSGFSDAAHPVVQGLLCYLDGLPEEAWLMAVPGNNEHPHAPWWEYREGPQSPYNPGATLAAFLIMYGEPGSARRARGLAYAERLGRLFSEAAEADMHDLLCLAGLSAVLRLAGRPELIDGEKLLRFEAELIRAGEGNWSGYGVRPSTFIWSKDHPLAREFEGLLRLEYEFSRSAELPGPTWDWGGRYPAEFAVSAHLWQPDLVLRKLVFEKSFE